MMIKATATSIALVIALAMASLTPMVQAQEIECQVASAPLPDAAVFVGYTRPNEAVLRAAAQVAQGSIQPYDGRHLADGDVLYAALPNSASSIELSSVHAYLNRLGPDHCVYQAETSGEVGAGWELWTSQALAGLFRVPSAAEQDRLRSYRPNCVGQSDPPEGQPRPCARAELLAVSDIDGDGELEFWHSAPYTWDTGLSIIEESPLGPQPLLAVCPGCSD